MHASAKILGTVVLALATLTLLVWSAALDADHSGVLRVSFLDVGSGSAALIEAPSGRQVLVDGGPDVSVLRALAAALPWWDRSLDVVVSTSPDRGVSTGLVDVLGRFRVPTILRSNIKGTDAYARALQSAIDAAEEKDTRVVPAARGQVIDIGGGAYLEVLSPDRVVSGVSARDGCVVMRLVYGATAFMLPCGASEDLQNYLAYLDGHTLHSDVLEVPGTVSTLFAGYVSPAYAVYSDDCVKSHDEDEAATLARFGAQILDTCTAGTRAFESDGREVRLAR